YGMLDKMYLIAAFTINSPIIIMDEPINGLDTSAGVSFKEEIKNYVERGGTIFFSTHLSDVAEKICYNVVIFRDGKMILHDKVTNITGDSSLESIFIEAQIYERDTQAY